MMGNEAVARGLYEADCAAVFAYPGTPSTEITEFASEYDNITAEWSPNEKVALEAALGAATAGRRAFCAMKHVGLNVAADPLFTGAYIGVNAGLVIAVADDPGMFSSQNEQDTRRYAIAAKLPLLEPSDSAECKELTKLAFEISEKFDIPVILRLSTRVAHTRSQVELQEREIVAPKDYVKNDSKNVMIPAYARGRRVDLEKRLTALREYSETSGINKVFEGTGTGIIAAGTPFRYARESAPDGCGFLQLRMLNPFPDALANKFASEYDKTVVVEELDPVIEERCRIIGLNVVGRELFSGIGELSQRVIAEKLGGKAAEFVVSDEEIPPRPPLLCAGCPHRGVFYLLSKMKLIVSGDIGCYALGASAPLRAVDTTVCMGASVSGLHGMLKAKPELSDKAVAVIGDSTFIHSGITGLIDIVYNRSNATVIILDNRITGMTGHQNNPANGFDIHGNEAPAIDLEQLCRAVGVKRVVMCDPYDLVESEKVIKQELAAAEPSVIIMRRPCALLKNVEKRKPLTVDADKCKGCKKCTGLGCPAISFSDKKAAIDLFSCVGCGICADVCSFGAIERGDK